MTNELSRRDFIAGCSAGLLALPPTRLAEAKGKPPLQISDNLFLCEDTCNVYLMRRGNRGILIDFGAGKILDFLPQLGISHVDGILHTHHHRDQCQGDHLAVDRKIPIAVPEFEQHLFCDVENFWRNRRFYHEGYETRNDYFTLIESVPVAARIPDYETFSWHGWNFYALPSPGHTLGSITLLAEVDGKRVAFLGDLMHSPGKVRSLHELAHHYGGNEGVDFTIYSLHLLRKENPDLLCPSHGEPMVDVAKALGKTIDALSEYYRFVATANPTIENQPIRFSPHLAGSNKTAGNFYVIISDSGKAMFIDYGFPNGDFGAQFVKATPVNGRCRFIEHHLDALRSQCGIKSIDVAMPTYTNDDHYCGFPFLQRKFGTRIWCYETIAEVLENPGGERLGALMPEPIRVEKRFRHGEHFTWEEFEFVIAHNPGHAEHQMMLLTTIDGKRIAFTGDNFTVTSGIPTPDGSLRIRPVVLNRYVSDSYQKAIRNLIELEPDLLAPGHGQMIPVTRQSLLATQARIDKRAAFYRNLIADPDTDFGLDATWVSIYPYQMYARAGQVIDAEIRVRNYRSHIMKVEVKPVLPRGWRAEPDVLQFEVPARGKAASPFLFRIPHSIHRNFSRLAICAEITADGRHLGQIAEAIITIERG
jgi:glyoxylase-like metal-dependent hydrolase (beta-lactamase superfamily II)